MIVMDHDVLSLIPQRPPIVMIDCLESQDETHTVASLEIRPENIFCKNGVFTEPGMVEAIAQTAAARVGHICKQEQMTPPVGFIAAVSHLKIHELPTAGQKIRMEVENRKPNSAVHPYKGPCHFEEALLAECRMKIFLNETETEQSH